MRERGVWHVVQQAGDLLFEGGAQESQQTHHAQAMLEARAPALFGEQIMPRARLVDPSQPLHGRRLHKLGQHRLGGIDLAPEGVSEYRAHWGIILYTEETEDGRWTMDDGRLPGGRRWTMGVSRVLSLPPSSIVCRQAIVH